MAAMGGLWYGGPMDRRLYDEDFFLWTQAQAEALRAEGARAGSNTIDWELLAEEVEDLGGSQLRECESRTRVIIEHLFKLAWSQRVEPKNGWRNTIRVQRVDLEAALTRSIEAKVIARLDYLHGQAAKVAAGAFADDEPEQAVDITLRWSWEQIQGHGADDPLA